MILFEGSPEALLESDDLLPTMLDFNVIWFLQEEASVKETWNARMNNKNGDTVSSTGSFHGDTPTDSSDNADKGGSSSSSSPEKDSSSGSLQEKKAS